MPKISHIDSFGNDNQNNERYGSVERPKQMNNIDEIPLSFDESGRFNLINSEKKSDNYNLHLGASGSGIKLVSAGRGKYA